MRVLISGISGFVGRHLGRALRDAGDEVHGFAEDGAAFEGSEGIDVACVDLLEPEALGAYLRRVAPDAVVHLGGLSHVGSSFDRPGAYFRVNVLGTRNLLRAATALTPAPRLVVASSAEVYGRVSADQQPIAEDRPLDPRSPYAWSKAAAELMALDAGAVVTRCFNIVGPGQAATFALPSFAAQLARIARGEAEPVVAVGDLRPRRDFSHVADAVAAYRLLVAEGISGTVYNIASGRAVTIAEALETLRAIAGVDAELRRDEARVRPVDVPLLCGDAGRLRSLGWRPRHDLESAMRDLWQALAPGVKGDVKAGDVPVAGGRVT